VLLLDVVGVICTVVLLCLTKIQYIFLKHKKKKKRSLVNFDFVVTFKVPIYFKRH